LHIKNAKLARNKSRLDTNIQKESININTNLPNYLIVSVDMQKVLQFPILDSKENYFEEKLSVYNETFAQLGKGAHSINYLSHEGEITKMSSDICNFYWKFFTSFMCNSAQYVILKTDNCFGKINAGYCFQIL
jgi:hypothetical protein